MECEGFRMQDIKDAGHKKDGEGTVGILHRAELP